MLRGDNISTILILNSWIKSCLLSPCLLSFYAEYIMRNSGLEEAQTRMEIAGKNINNIRYADDNILMEKAKSN